MELALPVIFLFLFFLGIVVFFLGGVFTKVKGLWCEESRLINLQQFGPWCWGEAIVKGGKEVYSGTAIFGKVKLSRRDYGKGHLEELGFTLEQAQWVEGGVLVKLYFKLQANRLVGSMCGTQFKFKPDNSGIAWVKWAQPTKKVWLRSEH